MRERRQERREERREGRRDGGADHYQMRQKLVSIGDDFWIENDRGERVYKVDGKALRIRSTLVFEDAHGSELAKIQQREARVRDTMEIEGRRWQTIATIKKAMITPLRERWTCRWPAGRTLRSRGTSLDHEYTIDERPRHGGRGLQEVVPASRDTYGVEIEPGQNVIVMLAVTTAIDMMTHPDA